MIVLKKDFVNENEKSYCKGRRLSSGKAYYLQKDNGDIVYGGKQCAEEYSNTDLSQIPDLTKSLIARHDGTITTGGGTSVGSTQNDMSKSKAISYILLREEKLSKFKYANKSLSYTILNEYYQNYQENNDLLDHEVKHILNIEKKSAENTNKKMSLQNLSTCYAYQYILERTLDYLEQKNNQDGIKYINGMIDGLHNYCSLTSNQINGLSKWLQFLPEELKKTKLKEFNI